MKILNDPKLPCNVEGKDGVIIDGVLYGVSEKTERVRIENNVPQGAVDTGLLRHFENVPSYYWTDLEPHAYQPLSSLPDDLSPDTEIIVSMGGVKSIWCVEKIREHLHESKLKPTALWCKVPKLPGEK